MADRDEILAAVRKNRPEVDPGDVTPETGGRFLEFIGEQLDDGALVQRFIDVVREIGGDAVRIDRDRAPEVLEERYPGMRPVYPDEAKAMPDVDSLASMNLFVCEGVLGVAENGAIWIPESNMGVRIAPFIAQHAAVILDASRIVSNMHAAYAKIDVAEEGFGVFVSGPSKTADIEQSLVLGAHGPRSLLVLLV